MFLTGCRPLLPARIRPAPSTARMALRACDVRTRPWRPGPRPVWGILSIDALDESNPCLRVLQHALHWGIRAPCRGGAFPLRGPAVAHREDLPEAAVGVGSS